MRFFDRRTLLWCAATTAVVACAPAPDDTPQPTETEEPGGEGVGEPIDRRDGEMFDPMADLLVVGGGVGAVAHQEIIVWTDDGELIERIEAPLGEVAVKWAMSRDRIAYQVAENRIEIRRRGEVQDDAVRIEFDGTIHGLDISPDGAHVAVTLGLGGVVVADIEGETQRRLELEVNQPEITVNASYLPDGELFVTAWDAPCPPQMFSSDGTELVWHTDYDGTETVYWAGDRFFLIRRESGTAVVENRALDTFEVEAEYALDFEPRRVALAPGRGRAAFQQRGGGRAGAGLVHILDLGSGDLTQLDGGRTYSSLAFSDDGGRVFTLNSREGINALDVETGEVGTPFEPPR